MPNLEEGIAASGRDDADVDRMIEIKVSYDRDPELALENTRFWAALSLTPDQKQNIHDPAEMQRLADALPIEQVAKRWIVSSDAEETAAAIKHYVDLGFRHLVFHGPGHDQRRFLSQSAEDVMPLLPRAKARRRPHRPPPSRNRPLISDCGIGVDARAADTLGVAWRRWQATTATVFASN